MPDQELAGTSANVYVAPYTEDRETIKEDFASASLLLMPSRDEGFGLVGLEAISACVPVLLSERSGFAELLRDLLKADADEYIVPVEKDLKKDATVWAERIRSVLRNRRKATENAIELRAKLRPHLRWDTAAEQLMWALEASTVATS